MQFEPKFLDYELSPYTGLTRESWLDAGKYLLSGIFKNLPSYDAPVTVPRSETEITYPHKNAKGNALRAEEMAQKFEGLARSLFIAAPLIRETPDIEIAGFRLRDYYSKQIIRACTKGDTNFVGFYEDLQELDGYKDPSRPFQQTVETCALVICLDICRNEIWDRYTKDEKDIVASFLSSYANAGTVPQNWRLFNMLDMAFLHKEGYEIDKSVMLSHAQAILNYYAGDGWYRDGQSFDYYSCWAFNVYAPIWNKWYGYENEPYLASRFDENANELMKTYPDFFDRDGFTNMWGRSCVYRCAAVSPLAENFTLKNPAADPGLARRIASGSLLQFLTRDDFLKNGVPTMGFYGEFSPLIQGYSCAESAYWLGKAFLCLSLDAGHPFWTAKENNGSWDKLSGSEVKETTLDGPALCFTNHGANGTTILRSGKVIKRSDDTHGMDNYSKLSYNSKYPWEASRSEDVRSMQYVLKNHSDNKPQNGNLTLWHGNIDGVLYRRLFFNYSMERDMHWTQAMSLADFPVEYGIIRADKLRLYNGNITLTLGAYGFPDNGTDISYKQCGSARAVILKGRGHTGGEKQLAFTVYDGWDEIDIIKSKNTNPDSEKSIVAYAKTSRRELYGFDRFILISQIITKESHEDFAENEIFPISEIIYTDKEKSGGFGPVTIKLKNNTEKRIVFEGIERNLQI